MYNYQEQKKQIFTEDGQINFLKIRDKANFLLSKSGAFMMGKIITGDSWEAMACIDRLVEIGELKELTGKEARGQDRVFV